MYQFHGSASVQRSHSSVAIECTDSENDLSVSHVVYSTVTDTFLPACRSLIKDVCRYGMVFDRRPPSDLESLDPMSLTLKGSY